MEKAPRLETWGVHEKSWMLRCRDPIDAVEGAMIGVWLMSISTLDLHDSPSISHVHRMHTLDEAENYVLTCATKLSILAIICLGYRNT
jgi:hypothetical protein